MKYLIAILLALTVALPTTANAAWLRSANLWEEVYNGYGSNTYQSGAWRLRPMSASQPHETHASLVLGKPEMSGNYRLFVQMTPVAQLRTGSTPNPWETGWITFGYNPDGTFKYLILKPNGLELGEFLGGYNQNFLYTSSDFLFPIGQQYNVAIYVKDGWIVTYVNGVRVMRYRMNERDLLNTAGRFGWYAEDAEVIYANANVRPF